MSKLVDQPVPKTIVRMAVPMLAGTFAMNMYHLTNAWFVSRLGTDSLAAISFTFPVVMLLMFVSRGLGSGSITLIAHALGAEDRARAARLAAHALALAVIFAMLLTAAGMLTIRPVFSKLGASGAVLDTTAVYMRIWYAGAVIMVLQIVTADIIISTGRTKLISALMVCSTGVNVVFDFGLIFGNFGMPKMGIAGAAVATIIAQGATLACALYILAFRLRLLDLSSLRLGLMVKSWGRILALGMPGALGLMLTPAAAAIITRLVARYGNAAVAASGVAGRIEMFAFMIPMTVGISLMPFVAQNYGARRMDRIRQVRKLAMSFAVLYGIFIGAMFIVFADPMARVFSDEQAVVDVLKSYIYITCAGYGLLEVHRYAGFCMTGVQEPLQASVLDIIRILVLLIPLSMLGGELLELNGIFWGRLATDLLAGSIGIFWSGRILLRKERRLAAA